jgi:hypothetical protein
LEHTGVDRILKHNRWLFFRRNVCLNDLLHLQRNSVPLNVSHKKLCCEIMSLARGTDCIKICLH